MNAHNIMFRTSITSSFSLLRGTLSRRLPAAALSSCCYFHSAHRTELFRFCSSASSSDFDAQRIAARKELSQEFNKQFEAPADSGDYYRIENVEDATPPPSVIEWRFARGSGPGGQAVNTSSNKAELRVNLSQWQMFDPVTLCDETLSKLTEQQAKKLAHDGSVLIVTSHRHRSLEKNKEECLAVVRQAVREASYVPPAAAPRQKPNAYVVKQAMQKRRVKSNFNKMKQSARAGKW